MNCRPCMSAWISVALLAAGFGSAQAAPLPDTIDRPVVIYVAGSAGGGIDVYARLVARHIGRHIPGNPTVTVQTMPGAGGIKAANYLAELARRDGTAMATFTGGPILEPLTGARSSSYGMNQFTWIGAVTRDVSVCVSWARLQFKTIEDVQREQMIVASTGAGSESDLWPKVVNDVIGTKFKLVAGYPGTPETLLAMEKGEVDGRCGWSWSSLKATKADWLRDQKINLLIQIALRKSPDLPNVPFIFDLLSKQEDRQLLDLMVGPSGMARPFAAPPGVPADKTALLRRAFDATMKDPEFLAEGAKMQADISPSTGEEVQALMARIYATPQPVIDRAKKLFNR
jgi:tripartite-type tricarboxylate transporter receptor subunit TctC